MPGIIEYNPEVIKPTYECIKDAIITVQDNKKEKTSTCRTDLIEVVRELSKSFNLLVDVVGPVRNISDDVDEFKSEFTDYFNEFKDYYDKDIFYMDKTHCSRIEIVRERLRPKLLKFLSSERAEKIDDLLSEGYMREMTMIDNFMPLVDSINGELEEIAIHMKNNDIQMAIDQKNEMVSHLSDQYKIWKEMRDEMNDTITEAIGKI